MGAIPRPHTLPHNALIGCASISSQTPTLPRACPVACLLVLVPVLLLLLIIVVVGPAWQAEFRANDPRYPDGTWFYFLHYSGWNKKFDE